MTCWIKSKYCFIMLKKGVKNQISIIVD